MAQSTSDESYSLSVNGNPMPDVMTVTQGETLTFNAAASFVYHGGSNPLTQTVTPSVTATVDIYLMQGSNVVDHKTYPITIGGITLRDGQQATFDTSSSGDTIIYKVPGTVTGTCMLKLAASVHASVDVPLAGSIASVDRSKTQVVILTVVPPTSSGSPAASPTPAPTPTPHPETVEAITVNNTTTSANPDGTIGLQAPEAKTVVTGEDNSTTTVAAAFSANLSASATGGQITSYITDHPDDTAATQFMLAAANSGSNIADIAYVLVVDHPDLANGEQIKNAVITMKVSEAWVDAHGGVGNISIIRYSDGASEMLNTTYMGKDPSDSSLLVFQAVSPDGLCQFALVSLAQLPVAASETVASGTTVHTGTILGIVVAALIVLLLVVGGVFVVLRRRKNSRKQ